MLIYGSMQCPDCVECCKDLDEAGVEYTFLEFSDNLKNLGAFLQIRDTDPIFADIKREGKIGIPCIVHGDGSISLNWK